MILIGDENIVYEKIEKISFIEDIKNTPANATVLFDFDIAILQYTQQNDIQSAVKVNSIKEVIYASNLDARYIICQDDIVKQTQKIADNYVYDSKILAIIEDASQIENLALDEIDGAIYKHILDD